MHTAEKQSVLLIFCIVIIFTACGASSVISTEAVESVYLTDKNFCISGIEWGMSPDELNASIPLVQFPAGSETEDYMNAKRVYFTPEAGSGTLILAGTQYAVIPLYEFEYGCLINVSYTLADDTTTRLDWKGMLMELENAFGEYKEAVVQPPSGEKIQQYNWTKAGSKFTFTLTFDDTQLISAGVNVMKTD